MAKVTIQGTKKVGFIVKLYNKKDSFKWDVALNEDELVLMYKEIKKKLKLK